MRWHNAGLTCGGHRRRDGRRAADCNQRPGAAAASRRCRTAPRTLRAGRAFGGHLGPGRL